VGGRKHVRNIGLHYCTKPASLFLSRTFLDKYSLYDNRAPKGGLGGGGEELGGTDKLMRSQGKEPKEEGRGGGEESEWRGY
jgi:hypothetical protein